MLDQASVSTLDAQVVWAIQHQADVRARLEQLERLRRKGLLSSGANYPGVSQQRRQHECARPNQS